MKLILLIYLLLSCSKQDYAYFFEKAHIYKGKTDFYFKETNQNTLIKKQIPRKEIPISVFLFEMPYDFVIALNSADYSMFEIINTNYKNTNLWFTLESLTTGEQIIGLPKDIKQISIIKEIANMMGIKTYAAKLAVKRTELTLSVSFQHKNIMNEKIWPIAFDVTFPKGSIEIYNKTLRPTNQNRMTERNSSGMNHSENKFMAIIDIDRVLNPFELNQLVFNDRSMPKIPIKKILNQPITTLISQTIIAIGPRKDDLQKQTVYTDKKNKIKILEATNIGAINKTASIYFEKSLPTVEELKNKNALDSKTKVKIFHKKRPMTFLLGQTKIKSKEKTDFYFQGIDDRSRLNKSLALTPQWFSERTIITTINKNGKVTSKIMTQERKQIE